MKKIIIKGLLITAFCTILSLAASEIVSAEVPVLREVRNIATTGYAADEIIVRFKNDSKPFRVININGARMEEKLKEYWSRGDVEYAEPNFTAHALWSPNDTYYRYQWNFSSVGMEDAWESLGAPGEPGKDVVVAVVDTGIAYEDYCQGSGWYSTCYQQASDLKGTCFVSGYDFINNDSHPNDDSSPGHGTHVAGTLAQTTNNNLGLAGISFNSCLMPVKVLDQNGSGSYADVADGIIWAADHGADVINLSLGGAASSQTLRDAVAYAYNHGVTIVAAAGNDNSGTVSYPAAYDDYVIAVGAVRYDETRAPYSNFGNSLDLVAPGGDMNVDQNGDGYGDGILQQSYEKRGSRFYFGYYFMQGTSMATPHVSGIAALVLADGKASNPSEVRNVLQESARDLGAPGRDDTYGWGLVDASNALGGGSVPAVGCSVDTDCGDGNECTTDVCVDAGLPGSYCQSNSAADGISCSDGQFCTVGDACISGVCQGSARDCSDAVTCTADSCSESADICVNAPDDAYCSDSLYCNGAEYCDAGFGCRVSAPVNCDDGNECTADSCSESLNACQNNPAADNTACAEGVCCQGSCSIGLEECSQGTLCWKADYQYLYRRSDQLRKFCKCAEGTYGYNSYHYTFVRATAFRYIDAKDNEKWDVRAINYFLPVYEVVCPDRNVYPTNQDYYY